jgi:hypothetical protein
MAAQPKPDSNIGMSLHAAMWVQAAAMLLACFLAYDVTLAIRTDTEERKALCERILKQGVAIDAAIKAIERKPLTAEEPVIEQKDHSPDVVPTPVRADFYDGRE